MTQNQHKMPKVEMFEKFLFGMIAVSIWGVLLIPQWAFSNGITYAYGIPIMVTCGLINIEANR